MILKRISSSVARLVSLMVLAAVGCQPDSLPPRLIVPVSSIQLGVMDPGRHEIELAIENGGGQSLRLTSVSSSCACTAARAPDRLKPKEKGKLRATVSVTAGPGTARLVVSTNDPIKQHIIQIAWFGKSSPRLLAPSLTFSPKIGQSASRDIEVSYAGGDETGRLRFVRAANLRKGMTIESVSEEPNAIRTIPGLGASPTEAPSLVVGKSILRVQYSGQVEAPLQQTAMIMMEQRGTVYQLPLEVVLAPYQALKSAPAALMFSADTLAGLLTLERHALIQTDTSDEGSLEIIGHPDFLNVRLERLTNSQKTVKLHVTVAKAPPKAAPKGEVVIREAGGSRLVIPIYVTLY